MFLDLEISRGAKGTIRSTATYGAVLVYDVELEGSAGTVRLLESSLLSAGNAYWRAFDVIAQSIRRLSAETMPVRPLHCPAHSSALARTK